MIETAWHQWIKYILEQWCMLENLEIDLPEDRKQFKIKVTLKSIDL